MSGRSNSSIISSSRTPPTSLLPACAYRSPTTSKGARTLARMRRKQFLVGLPADEETGDGHEEPLLVDLAPVRPEAPSSEVEGMAAVAEEGDDLAFAEDRASSR